MGTRRAVAGVLWLGMCATDVEETRVTITALRDGFVQSAKDAGLVCPIGVPAVLVEDVPSFGSYDPETDTLRTSAWSLHALGRGVQACRGITEKTTKWYALEFGADRIAAAYWNEHDPGVIAHQRPVFEATRKPLLSIQVTALPKNGIFGQSACFQGFP